MKPTSRLTPRFYTTQNVLKVTGAAGLIAIVLLVLSPDTNSRITAVGQIAMVAVLGLLAYQVTDRRMAAADDLRESLDCIVEIVEKLEANPATAAAGQRAVDELRNIWGDELDQRIKRAPLN